MILVGDRVVCCTGDLVAAAQCEFGLLRTLDAELGLVAPVAAGASAATAWPAEPEAPAEHEDIDLPGLDIVRITPPGSGTPTGPESSPAAGPGTGTTAERGSGTTTERASGTTEGHESSTATTEHGTDATTRHRSRTATTERRRGTTGTPDSGITTEPGPGTAEGHEADTAAGHEARSPEETVAALHRAHEQTLAALRSGAEAIAGAIFFDGSFAARGAALVRIDPVRSSLPESGERATGESAGSETEYPEFAGADHDPARDPDAAPSVPTVFPAPAAPGDIHGAAADLPTEWSDSAAIDHGMQGRVVDGDALSCSFAGQPGPGRAADPAPNTVGTDGTADDAVPTRYALYATLRTDSPIAALIELAACADMMRRNGVRVDPMLRVWHPDGSQSRYPLADAARVYAARRRRLTAVLEAKQNELLPVQWGDRRYLACGRCATCTAELVTGRDLLLVAGMRPAVRAQLRDAGIATVDRLVRADAAVTRVATRTFGTLRRQAELQVRAERTGRPVHELTNAAALAALPTPSPGDVFLTVAGTPATVVGIGVLPARAPDPGEDAPSMLFHAFGLHDDPAALLEFLADRQERHPDLRIYHYRSPARSLLAELCACCGADEEIADDLLGALVDLYPIVRAALIVGERSYGPAALTGLLGAEFPITDLESECARIPRLRDRLRELATEHGIPAAPAPRETPSESPAAVEAALREFAFDTQLPRTPAQHAAALAAAALGYRRRERQPLHWAHADRLHRPIAEWADTPGVLAADWGTVDTKWHSSGRAPMRRYLKLTGRLGTGSAPPPGTPVLTLYDQPVAGMRAVPGRRATARATVLGCALDDNFDDAVRVEESLPEGCEPYDDLPVAIVPALPGRDENIEAALEFAAHRLLMTLPEIPDTAGFDLLLRRPPRLRSAAALPEVFGDHAAAVTAAVLDLDDSCVAVQGPSGTGKTDTAARVIERLVTRYKWRVGVVAQSHWAVEEVLDAVVRVGVLPELVAKSEARAVAPEWLAIDPARYPRFLDNAVNGCVIGGLPSDLADAERVAPGRLDLLMIADAGHFPLADAVAVACGARNLLLLGDPAPLPALGAHPEPVHESALGRLVGDNPTLPPEFGYFLDRTWRMHPRLCEPVSRLRYGGRLRSTETVTLARDLDGVPPGVRSVPVEHHGNGTESAEEAREIVRRVRALLGLSWRQGAVTRRLHPHDILVVTPYHAQAARIRTLLSRARIEDVVVGTAERFAGREAAVVLVSMTSSSPAEAPHGVDTLLSRHWLTTVVSRALWSALVVHSPLLTEYLPETPEQLADLAAFLELVSP
ncbi:bifunctional RecB family nuclease/DEAD/DEAH box helicase [Nocardia sp. BMG51109]|uniref:bifunctional RecB family nuclease/DEAD/DEAH box helicase n=1 Tax=Nocardia sp. BMG51109 TaxID=1056816 RepID=UPI000464C7E2|nr:bifunctional RecB family nuclease/DEAD/DEAH box helicase [Nocardia sp. BMG51109]